MEGQQYLQMVEYQAPQGHSSPDESNCLAIVKADVPANSKGSIYRDEKLVKVNVQKRDALIKAWEEKEKAKADNKYQKNVANANSWENTKKSYAEIKLRKKEEKLEKKNASYVEKKKNETAVIHRAAEGKKAIAVAKRFEEVMKVDQIASKYRADGRIPHKFIGCFGA